jgi:hypothetical protein
MRALRGGPPGRTVGGWRAAITGAVIVLTTIAFGASSASASAGTAAGPGSGVRRASEGTATAKSGYSTRVRMRHGATAAPADASGDLSTVSSQTLHGGYTAAGIGMRNQGFGTISITGVPAGATVKSATLLWDIIADQSDPTFAQGTVDGSAITGTSWSSGPSPCWSEGGTNWSYEADVTSQVTGNGSYALAGFASGDTDGSDPWNVGTDAPLLDGASLVVVYQLASMPEAVIQIAEGASETDSGNTADATLDGFTASTPVSATTTYIVGDGQSAGNTASFDDAALPDVSFPGADPQAAPDYSQGNLWDTVTTDASSLVTAGDTSADLSVTGNEDCIVWVGQVLAVSSAPCQSSVSFGLYRATAEDDSCLIKNGSSYTDTGPVNLNGLDLVPNAGVVTIDTGSGQEAISADDATVRIGNFPVFSGPIPATSLAGSFDLDTDKSAKIGGVDLDVGIELKASGTDGLTISGIVTLPPKLGKAVVAMTAELNSADGLKSVGLSAKDFFIPISKTKIGLKDFSLSYDLSTNTWTGGATIGLPTPSGAEVAGMITITDGKVTQFSAEADGLNRPLGPDGVFLQSIGAAVVVEPPPPSITGTASITAGPMVKGVSALSIDGSLGYIFSTPGQFKVTGSLKLLKGTSFGTKLVNGALDYYTDGHITASGSASVTLGKVVKFDAGLDGWVNGTAAFSLSGSSHATVGALTISGEGVMSTAGIAACGRPFGSAGPSVGFGYLWGGSVHVMASSCELGPYALQPQVMFRPDGGGPAAVGLSLPGGLPVASFKITGNNKTAPAGTLTDPNGDTLAIDPAQQGFVTSTTPEYGVGVDAARGVDYVVIDAPTGGAWTFTPSPGSSVTSVSSASGLPKPSLSARVSGTGLHRKLSWKIAHLPGQKVTFVEEGTGVDHVLASNEPAGSGRKSFTPADGPAGRRLIDAVVTQNGLTRQTVKVASYTAPATASIRVTVRKSGRGRGVIKVTPTIGTCRSVCSLSVRTGQVMTLKPVPAHGSKFSWTQGLCTGNGTCKLTVTQLTAVAGTFTR